MMRSAGSRRSEFVAAIAPSFLQQSVDHSKTREPSAQRQRLSESFPLLRPDVRGGFPCLARSPLLLQLRLTSA